MMRYKSTRGSIVTKSSAEAIIQGIAEDNGLYVPDHVPVLPFDVKTMIGKPYRDFAFEIIKSFFNDYTDDEIRTSVDNAYDEKFESREIAPIFKGGDVYLLELYYGKTAAFKDMALSLLPRLLVTAMKKNNTAKICVLTATSGDTGKAALEGFADVQGTEIIVFYPNNGVSKVQERQMLTQAGHNTHVFAVNGNFDDAQTGVKKIFNDTGLTAKLLRLGYTLSSANSINIGRLIPQIVYYVYGYAKLIEQGAITNDEKINIVVPTGNFGNILSAYYAKEMGLPVNKLICASNKNKVLADFINTGRYDANREFYQTNSPSMDILISSNLERLLYHLSGENVKEIKRLMESLDKNKFYEVDNRVKEGLNSFIGGFADVPQTNEAIHSMYKENNYLMDTHTAVAYKVYKDYKNTTGDQTVTLIASTASAYKFADSVALSIGLPEESDGFAYIRALRDNTNVKIQKSLEDLDRKEILHTGVLNIDRMSDAIEKTLAKRSGIC